MHCSTKQCTNRQFESVHIFCSASKIARDVCQKLFNAKDLNLHYLEDSIILEKMPPIEEEMTYSQHSFKCTMMFLSPLHRLNLQKTSLTQVGLYYIASKVCSQIRYHYKLEKEEKWKSMKEILGQMFNCVSCTMQSLSKKLNSTHFTIKSALQKQCIKFKELECLNQKLRHATLAMPQEISLF